MTDIFSLGNLGTLEENDEKSPYDAIRAAFDSLPNQSDKLKLAMQIMEHQRTTQTERLRQTLKAESVPISANTLKLLSELRPVDLMDVMTSHPGFAMWEKCNSYKISLRIFNQSLQDLSEHSDKFETALRDDILSNSNSELLELYESQLQKELFCFLNASHSLVELSTRQLKVYLDGSEINQKRKESFGEDGLHPFLMGLRVILHHLYALKTGWLVRNGEFTGKPSSVTLNKTQIEYLFRKRGDSLNADQRQQGSVFLKGILNEEIDLKNLIDNYGRRAQKFHAWFSNHLSDQRFFLLRDCERCFLEHKRNGVRTYWKAMIGNWLNWEKPPNPYEYLNSYLSAEQVEEVMSMPLHSNEQIDRAIEIADIEKACDDEVRGLIHKFFRRSFPS